MPEPKEKSFTAALMRNVGRGAADEPDTSFTAERQLTAQAFNLQVEYRDGRRSEGFAWSHYGANHWSDDGSHETLIIMFGARAIEIEGHNLGVLVSKIREGQLNGIRELSGAQALSLQQENPDNQPIITSVRSYPDFAELLKELKGETDEPESGYAGRVRGR
jgi:hypothetical protein